MGGVSKVKADRAKTADEGCSPGKIMAKAVILRVIVATLNAQSGPQRKSIQGFSITAKPDLLNERLRPEDEVSSSPMSVISGVLGDSPVAHRVVADVEVTSTV